MYHINFSNPIKVHFIGIGGISMSGLAELLHTIGFNVVGSDAKKSKITEHLESLGITVLYGQRASNITTDLDLVVYTTAVKESNTEYQAVIQAGIPIMDRAELLGQVMLNYTDAIAISGTHGKTTTTSMLSLILLEANLDPTISVGGILDNINGNIRIGRSEHFITEACEYTNSFLKFNPTKSIILNVEAEHLDFFKDLDDIRHSFRLFAERLPENGLLVINGDIENVSYFTKDLPCSFMTYSINESSGTVLGAAAHYTAANIQYDSLGHGHYDLMENGKLLTHIELNVIGIHNVSNSLPAIALARSLNISLDVIKKALYSFTGTERRFQYKGEIGGVTIIDDYAHHPTEVVATLTAAKNYPHKTTWCVFQPHTYTRTKAFLKEFASALSLADKIVLADIYAARENNPGDISSRDLQDELIKIGKDAYYLQSFDDIENFLLQNCNNGDLLITMGAGDVVTIGEALLGI
ncbi:UDP-N-acetylmuramate--L-alanine ligase [Anaerocolumna sp. MB42-C2]|uniref:UDP-N-acetylmuramate--L-alanine ligase n=1 Tax=Anaerocolumna sp. MB42-C2 TaxID=3070997 RepID=UPI0027E04F06|nr:UDP-N-acetylmuramate--L-alanine ligase [Anaerocolumna sp. MB42-C2]WMJ90578.1 UDP-N-acetylmuramate--L-alanine ligase [Anaerocolumna sp. MB42-C2]